MVKKFSGFMNTDDAPAEVGFLQHMFAWNMVFRGTVPNARGQNVVGNTLVPNSFLPSTGTNYCLYALYDQVKQRIFIFQWNSTNKHGIYQYDIATKTFAILVQCFTNTIDDVLGFNLNRPIPSAKIVYGDTTLGDLLCFCDSLKRPTKINITRALTGGYGANILRSYIDVAREPSIAPPYCAYENDATVTLNNLRGKLFKFKARYYFDDKDASVTSSLSEIPLPIDEQNPDVQSDETKNAVVKVLVQTGASNVRKIEILGSQSLGTQFGDYFSIATLTKATLSIPDNDIYTFNFYNDKTYASIDAEQSDQLFDYVPLEANDNELLNGNTLIYGGIKEGYNLITPNVVLSPNKVAGAYGNSNMQVSQSGDSGFGVGNIHIVLIGTPVFNGLVGGTSYLINTTSNSISVAATTSTNTGVISQLSAAFVSNGFAVLSATGNELTVTKSGEQLLNFNTLNPSIPLPFSDSIPAYDDSNKVVLGLVYFDGKGRTNGVITSDSFVTQTFSLQDLAGVFLTSDILANIYHRPPVWARYYQWVRSANTTKSSYLYWVTDSVLIDDKYVYLSLSNLNQYIKDNPTTLTQLSYGYSIGDRVKILLDCKTNAIIGNDYVIEASPINPVVNGSEHVGQYIKINKPTNFTFTGQFYEIEPYAPTKNFTADTQLFYEFGERYTIGNAGTVNAVHQGQLGNQSANLVTPATFRFLRGDGYLRYRTINVGNVIEYNIPSSTADLPNNTVLGQERLSIAYSNPNYITAASATQSVFSASLPGSDNWTIQEFITPTTFRLTGTLNFTITNASPSTFFDIIVRFVGATGNFTIAHVDSSTVGVLYSIPIDITLTLPSNARWYVLTRAVGGCTVSFQQSNLKYVETGKVFTVKVYSQNFSDFYPSAINSNGRAFVYQPTAIQSYFPQLIRWGLSYQIDTNVNLINRFYPQNLDEVDSRYGDIQRLLCEERLMYVYQNRKVGSYGVYARFIQNNDGDSQLVTTNDIITANNINYMEGDYGLGSQYRSLIAGKNAHYFTDPVRGYQIRRAPNGLQPISELYKGQYSIRGLLTPYNQVFTQPNGSPSWIIGYYDFLEEQFGTILQAGTNASGSIGSYNFTFNEPRNAYSSFFGIFPEYITCAEEIMYYWKDGEMYVQDGNAPYCNFFGVQDTVYIVCPFNENLLEKKTWQALTEIAGDVWECPAIYTNVDSYEIPTPQRQESELIPEDFSRLEQNWHASFLRDKHSVKGINRGDLLKGNYMVITFKAKDASVLSYLSEVSVKYTDSALTSE